MTTHPRAKLGLAARHQLCEAIEQGLSIRAAARRWNVSPIRWPSAPGELGHLALQRRDLPVLAPNVCLQFADRAGGLALAS